MCYYDYKDYGAREIRQYENCEYKDELAYICYSIYGRKLKIEDIAKTGYARLHFKNKEKHFGTKIFKALLLHLKERKEYFNTIEGILSASDAQNNWFTSIPFYYNFPKYIDTKKLKYSLKFHLYDYQYNEIHLPPNKKDMLKEINKLIKFHENIGKNAYFIFEICE